MNLRDLRIGLVGPLPPPAGGMASQTRQLGELLEGEGARVTIVQVNAPYRPRWSGRIRGLRALFRLAPYVVRLWAVAGRVQLLHVMANSGWSWHLFAVPAIVIARLRGVPVVVNYRGGEAGAFLDRAAGRIRATLRLAGALAVPSGYLEQVFARHGIRSVVVPNIVDLERFRPTEGSVRPQTAHVVVARNLEPIYDIGAALRAFARIRREVPEARMSVAGTGPEEGALKALAATLGVGDAVRFCGRLDRDEMAALYRSASVTVNPSRVDNMPNSVLEAMASGVPVVSTNVGGVPFVVRDGATGLLVAAGDDAGMAEAVLRIVADSALAARLATAALADVQRYAWPRVRQRWLDVYASLLANSRAEVRLA